MLRSLFLIFSFSFFLMTRGWASSPDLQVQLLDVGVGEAVLVRWQGENLLIDAGSAESSARLIKLLKAQGVSKLALFILTDNDPLRIGGAKAVLQAFSIQRFWGFSRGRKAAKSPLREAVEAKGAEMLKLRKGRVLRLGSSLALRVLETGSRGASLAFRLEYKGFRMLFANSLNTDDEARLLKKPKLLQSDVLKIGRFGQSDASSEGFLQAVAARLAVVSTPRKEQPTPDITVRQRLEKRSTPIASVSQEGHIWLRSDGASLWISSAQQHSEGYVLLSKWRSAAPQAGSGQIASPDISDPIGASPSVKADELPSDDDAGAVLAGMKRKGEEKPAPTPQVLEEQGKWYAGTPQGREVINRSTLSSKEGYIAHKASKFFHHAACRSVLFIPKTSRITFKTRKQAIQSGRKPSGICSP
jgi:competence protein ComEC